MDIENVNEEDPHIELSLAVGVNDEDESEDAPCPEVLIPESVTDEEKCTESPNLTEVKKCSK